MILQKLIGYCCEQEMVDAANRELAYLLSLEDENAMLRRMLSEAFDEYIGDGDEPVSLEASFKRLRDYDRERVTTHATDKKGTNAP